MLQFIGYGAYFLLSANAGGAGAIIPCFLVVGNVFIYEIFLLYFVRVGLDWRAFKDETGAVPLWEFEKIALPQMRRDEPACISLAVGAVRPVFGRASALVCRLVRF